MLTVKHNIPRIQCRLKRIRIMIDGGYHKEAVDLMRRVRDEVAEQTPRSKDETTGGQEVGKGGQRKNARLASRSSNKQATTEG